MAKTTRSSTTAKAQKTHAAVKAGSAKGHADKSGKPAKAMPAKSAARASRGVAKPVAKAASKRATAKPGLIKPASKKSAKPASKPVAAKKPAPKKSKAAGKPVSKKLSKPAASKGVAAKKPAAGKKVVSKKVVAKKAGAKTTGAKKIAVKKVVSKKPTLKKPAAKKLAAKTVARQKPAVGKQSSVKPVSKSGGVKHVAAVKALIKATPKAAKVAAPAKPPKTASDKSATTGKHVGKVSAPVSVAKESPAPTSSLYKGKVASATAMVTTRPISAGGHHASSSKNRKDSLSSMNRTATKKLENGVTREDGRYALPATSNVALPKGYRPSASEEYMGPKQLAYFRNKLRDWRAQLVEESRQTMDNLRGEVRDVGDEAERATRETENSLELRTRDRYRKLIAKIDKALRRVEEGSYGFCEETDEEIGVERLDARPIATLSLDAQERREHLQKQMGD